jgi:hypothetical protein
MPLSWVGRRDGVRLAPPQGPTGRGFRKVAAIQARTLAVGQTRKVPKRRYLSSRRRPPCRECTFVSDQITDMTTHDHK